MKNDPVYLMPQSLGEREQFGKEKTYSAPFTLARGVFVHGNQKILEVIRLLEARNLSMRQIAKQTGISRGSVATIYKGIEREKIRIAQQFDVVPTGPVQRCPNCGAKTRLPCLSCEIRKLLGEQYLRIDWGFSSPQTLPLKIELREHHQKRYLEVRKWREQQKNPNFTIIPEEWPWRNKAENPPDEQGISSDSIFKYGRCENLPLNSNSYDDSQKHVEFDGPGKRSDFATVCRENGSPTIAGMSGRNP